ncbi:MAG: hypothetical protein JW873_01285 [Candidatus Saganbacteria bacterium]|nr:hypothetical protein [Candidatus Saganbacteria bacterium]
MARRNGKKAEFKLIEEMRKQLLIQAERLGIRDRYTPQWFAQQRVLSAGKVLSELYAERSNLEYELNLLASDKKELLIKLERLNVYIKKGEGLRSQFGKEHDRVIDKEFKLTENGAKLACLKRTAVKAAA